MGLQDQWARFLALGTIDQICLVLMDVSILLIFLAIFMDFIFYQEQENTQKKKKSVVETGSMTAFFLLFCFVIRIRIGEFTMLSQGLSDLLKIVGTGMVVFGTYVNLYGRIVLGKNWANQIKIYEDHTLIKKGPYRVIRHPLYSSIILMLFGGAIVYQNWVSFLMVLGIFVPFMNYRAKQEEELLMKVFPEYEGYKKEAGRFLPKLRRERVK